MLITNIPYFQNS